MYISLLQFQMVFQHSGKPISGPSCFSVPEARLSNFASETVPVLVLNDNDSAWSFQDTLTSTALFTISLSTPGHQQCAVHHSVLVTMTLPGPFNIR